jgi:hypothetical protein
MKITRTALIAVTAGVLMSAGAGYGLRAISTPVTSAPSAPAAHRQVICAVNPCRITMERNGADGLVIQDAPGPRLENSLLIIDPIGLAEFWQNSAGAYEGPAGEICTTNQVLAPVACLGSDGKTGRVRIGRQVLTAADIAWLHRAERSGRHARVKAARPNCTG